ncbi:putative zinc-binding protein [Caloramator sp. Dgby_cultured_2]|uniref:putative zinc-binding protein n=1 Tax=Caloramator sp. Dgby_cultured_2 TaxID=3029174 RepID=UPI00237E2675|nr:putative zinc-binding protein [Caloramator sp. Dgby_cultured_2]WDU83422.1 putative zinc-binding protein [Caloramator sp. Dgby_cultured_2]
MSKVVVIPCSGMGKVYGLIAREAALKVVRELKKDEAETKCLAYLVTGDEEIKNYMQGKKCITIDGCPKMCAAKMLRKLGQKL